MTTADGRSGSTVGKYRLHEVVGRGGMGVVYRAEHVYIGREVAVKILHEGYGGREESIKRFLREARAASLINHPNIVEVTDFGKANDGTVFFVMELLVGEPLDAILSRDRRLDLLRSITICNQLTAALAAAHAKDIIHRDLKPENVMLIPREGRRELVRRVADESGAYELSEREKQFDFVKILDFGVAKVREPEAQKGRVTKAGIVFGTPEYMAPETARVGYSDARSDIYALGIMFYEMITGTVPFTGDAPVEVMMKQVNERVPPMRKVAPDAEITDEAERMILKALAKDPEQRQQSMEEFHRDLQKCYGQLRFRRTLRTPTTSMAGNGPQSGTIPLVNKKKQQPPLVAGAIPGALRAGGSSPGELETAGGVRLRAPTPRLPGLPLNATAPILLTKKKAPRTDGGGATTTVTLATALERTNMGVGATTTDPAKAARAAAMVAWPTEHAAVGDDVPLGPDAITREIPKEGVGSTVYAGRPEEELEEAAAGMATGAAAATTTTTAQVGEQRARQETPPSAKKRTTLPLGTDQSGSGVGTAGGAESPSSDDRPTPANTISVIAAPVAGRDGDATDNDGRRGEGDGDGETEPESGGLDIGPVMIALADRSASGAVETLLPDRATPRVSAASGGTTDERSWLDEPTSPAVPGYPAYPGKAGKSG